MNEHKQLLTTNPTAPDKPDMIWDLVHFLQALKPTQPNGPQLAGSGLRTDSKTDPRVERPIAAARSDEDDIIEIDAARTRGFRFQSGGMPVIG